MRRLQRAALALAGTEERVWWWCDAARRIEVVELREFLVWRRYEKAWEQQRQLDEEEAAAGHSHHLYMIWNEKTNWLLRVAQEVPPRSLPAPCLLPGCALLGVSVVSVLEQMYVLLGHRASEEATRLLCKCHCF